jgi:hypothetical protein
MALSHAEWRVRGEVVAMHQITNISPLDVRDPQHKPDGSYGRRLSDFEISVSLLAAIIALALFLGGSFWSSFVRVFTNAWNERPVASVVRQASAIQKLRR